MAKEPTLQEYRISELRFSYCYRADGYSDAIAKWLKATFVKGCTATEPDNFGRFQVICPAGKQAPALVIDAIIRREGK